MKAAQPPPERLEKSVANLLFFGLAIVWAALGGLTLAQSIAHHHGPLGPSAAGVLLVAGGLQGALAYAVRKRAAATLRFLRADYRNLAAWLLAGGTLALAASLTFVDRADRAPVFLAGMAGASTLLFAVAARAQAGIKPLRGWTWRRWGAVLGTAALALWGFEAVLRMHDAAAKLSLDDAYTVRTLSGMAADEHAPFDIGASPRMRRVAVLGALPGGRIRFPAVSWRQWQAPGAGLHDYALLVERPLWDSPPELLLVCVSAAGDQLQVRPPRDFWETRSWKLWQAAALSLDRVPPRRGPVAASDEERLARELDALRACRGQPDERVEAAWRENRAAARRLLAACRAQGVDVALVVVPEPFQTDAGHWQRLVRCSGAAAEEFDVRLPQHRWKTLSVDLGVPIVDLLPHGAGPAPQFAAARLSDWLDRRFGRAPWAPDSSVVSSK